MSTFPACMGPRPVDDHQAVELPDDTLPTAWAPEIAAVATRDISEKSKLPPSGRLHRAPVVGRRGQPASKEDWWIMDGGARNVGNALRPEMPPDSRPLKMPAVRWQ